MVLNGNNAYQHIVESMVDKNPGYWETFVIDADDGAIDVLCFRIDNFGLKTETPYRNVFGQVQLRVRK
ncbi:hypothetical protein ABGV42_01300 [Paenibacillus pabuli]|uniref:hypothetical protein n=1 Tax=Paenibacillus pabuli TaxID=1472 RepID=UPI003241E976